ncbi:MAG: ComEC/Rec2 family competence protein [Armatimonadetes bacterium]|nr:ComEC/Rec2 family competence protein [Armatimonadota bacterium]
MTDHTRVRPLAWVTGALAAGVAIGEHAGPLPMLLGRGGALLVLIALAAWLGHPRAVAAGLLLLAAVAGAVLERAASRPPAPGHVRWLVDVPAQASAPRVGRVRAPGAGRGAPGADAAWSAARAARLPVTVRGVVVRPPEARGDRVRAVLDIREVRTGTRRFAAHGLVQASLPPEPVVRYGDLVEVTGRLRRPPDAGNPGEFSYRAYLARQGIHVTLHAHGPPRVLARSQGGPAVAFAVGLRDRMVAVLHAALPPPQGGLMASLLLGTKPPEEMWQAFTRAGVVHLLVVSGFQVGLVAAAILSLLRWSRAPRWLAVAAAAALVLLFALVVGVQPSVARAAVMALAGLLAWVVDREKDAWSALAAAALVILIADPLALFSTSFQLSFAATMGLMYVAPEIARRLAPGEGHPARAVPGAGSARDDGTMAADLPSRRGGDQGTPAAPAAARAAGAAWRYLASLLGMSLGAQIAVLPILVHTFGAISVVAPLANLLLVPLSVIMVPIGLLGAVAGLVHQALATAILFPMRPLLVLMTEITARLAESPLAVAGIAPPPPWLWVFYCAAVVGAVEALRWRYRPSFRQCALGVAAAVAVAVWAQAWAAHQGRRLEVTFIDVGQGDAIFVRAPGGRTVLIDAGGAPAFGDRVAPPQEAGGIDLAPFLPPGSRDAYDVGERRVVPYLRRRGVRRIDLLVITHPHEDHVGGVPAVIQNIPVGLVWESGYVHLSPSYLRLRRLLTGRGIPVRAVHRGEGVDLGGGVRLRVFHPSPPLLAETGSDVNNNSIVLGLVHGNVSTLLTGDVEAPVEERLLADAAALPSQAIKVAHHGGRTSTTPSFLLATRPRIAVISVGSDNPFGHPHPRTLEALRAAGTRVYRTDRHGAVTLVSDGRVVWARAFRHPEAGGQGTHQPEGTP